PTRKLILPPLVICTVPPPCAVIAELPLPNPSPLILLVVPIVRVRVSAMIRLPVPLASRMDGSLPLGTRSVAPLVHWMSPPFVDGIRAAQKPPGQLMLMLFGLTVALSESTAIAPPPVFPRAMLLALIVAPLDALRAMLAAFTLPLVVPTEFEAATIPLPPPL